MIPQETVAKIHETANIVEVISDFISLKRAGSNYKGVCPFHNEKTPSFMVSPAKGIYKCFGCGAAGNSTKFVMEHEKIDYPSALKYLAKKYNIDVVEKELTPDEIKNKHERESLFIVTEYAKNFFVKSLFDTEEGRNIGLSYFNERGYKSDIIKKFELGWSPEKRDALTSTAERSGYKLQFLQKTGLSIVNTEKNYKFDRFSGRVMFPIHSISGKVIGFGGRVLRTDKKIAKYLNSPESDIYHKSKTLYGIYFAKSAIVKKDKCIMVEGYTDVISLHLAGVENVVASSGTSLTIEQIKMVRRFTKNMTVIYDGDPAGIKASLRGIDMILAEEMNVKVVLLPEGEDPDSFSKSMPAEEFQDYIEKNEEDFIRFKTNLLIQDAQNDPVKRAQLTREIVKSIAVIPDIILRAEYIRECSAMLKTDEKILYNAMVKVLPATAQKGYSQPQQNSYVQEVKKDTQQKISVNKLAYAEMNEKELVCYLLKYGDVILPSFDEEKEDEETVGEFIIYEMQDQELEFLNPTYKTIYTLYQESLENDIIPNSNFFLQSEDEKIRDAVTDALSPQQELSKIWQSRGASVETFENRLSDIVPDAIERFKLKVIQLRINEVREKIKNTNYSSEENKLMEYIEELKKLDTIKIELANFIDKAPIL